MVKSDIEKVLSQYNTALGRFEEVLAKDAKKEDAFIDASIQRFEFCFELSWKMLKRALQVEGLLVNTPREAFAEALKQGWLVEGDAFWMTMIESRNLSSHTYREEMARQVYELLPRYLLAFKNLGSFISSRYQL